MDPFVFAAVLFAAACHAGWNAAVKKGLDPLAGTVVISIGAALVSVIATSSGAAAAYVREGYSNVRVGMFLEIATTIGALTGAGIAVYFRASVIAIVFGVVLLVFYVPMSYYTDLWIYRRHQARKARKAADG